MTGLDDIVVVGASLAGLRATELLRRSKPTGRLTLVGAEPHLPYDRPPLSKELLRGEWDAARIGLRKKSYDDLDITLRLGRRALSVDVEARRVHLDDGEALPFDGLVIATGGTARRLPGQPEMAGVHTLRTLDDALAIRRELTASSRVAVIGAGFIGAEVAASARQLGLEVTMVEALHTPLERSLGPRLGERLRGLHEQHGVRVLCGRTVQEIQGVDRVCALVLDDGTSIEVDLVVVGIGMTPSVSWLEGSGIALEDGVRCDETLAASVAGVVAAGDVASWFHPLFEERLRVEHWTNAVEQARHAVRTLLAPEGEATPFASVPTFWSDQFDIKIQGAGRPRSSDELIVREGSDDRKLVALYGRAGRLSGAVAFNQPAKLVQLRMLMAKRGSLEDALEVVAT